MASPTETETENHPDSETTERDERIGEAIEAYLSLVESGTAPDADDFANSYPDLKEDLKAALDGLAMVQGLVGDSGVGAGGRLEAGRRVAGYRIVRELGRGGMGIVYEAVHVDLDRPVALKVLGIHAAPDSTGRRRFLNEAKTAAGLHHTHIVPVFDVGQVGGLCYYAMQRIEGCGLDRVVKALRKEGRPTGSGSGRVKVILSSEVAATIDLMNASGLGDPTRSWFAASAARRAGGPIPNDERSDETPPFSPPTGSEYYLWVARAGQQAADALSHAHCRGVIHRDIKPSNLLVDGRGTVWVADFGLARRISDPSMTQTESLIGTPRYMSPEQALQGPIDVLTDVYSLGATLYELLTLRAPHDGKTTAELIGQIRDKEPISPRKIDPKLPRDLETIVLKAMGKSTTDRYVSAGDLADDLDRFLAMEPVKARRIGPIGRVWRFARRHPSLTAVSIAAAAAILATATIAYVRVVHERNKAVIALNGETTARKELNTALIQSILDNTKIIRQMRVPDVRRQGLVRLQNAVARKPSAEMMTDLRDEAVQLLALRDIEPKPELKTGSVQRLAFLGSGDRLATLVDNGADLVIWDVVAHEKMIRYPLASDSGEGRGGGRGGWGRGSWSLPPLIGVAGTNVAVIRPGGRGIRIYDTSADTKTGSTVFTDLPMAGQSINGVVLTADARRLVTIDSVFLTDQTGGGRPQIAHRVNLWDTKKPATPIAVLADDDGTLPTMLLRFPIIAASPDGKTIALAWWGDQDIHLFSSLDGKMLGKITADSPTAIAFSEDGTLAASCTTGLARWDVASMKPLPGVSFHQNVRGLRFSRGGKMLAAWWGNGVEIWDPEANTLIASISTNGPINDLAFAPDGRTMAASVGNTTRIWAVVNPVGRSSLAAPASKTPSRLSGLVFSPSGALAATFMVNNKSIARLQCPGGSNAERDGLRTSTLGFDPNDRLVVPNGKTLEFYNGSRDLKPTSLVAVPDPPVGTNNGFVSADFVLGCLTSANGRILALPRIGDTLLVRFDRPDAPPTITSVLRDIPANDRRGGGGNRAGQHNGFSGGGGLGPPPDGPPPIPGVQGGGTNRGGSGIGLQAIISPSGDRFYFIVGQELRISVVEGNRLRDLRLPNPPKKVSKVAASLDGRYLAIGHFPGGEVSIVSAKDASLIGSIPAASDTENDPVTALAFSRDGQLAIGTKSGTIRLWSVSNGEKPVEVITLPNFAGEIRALAYAPETSGRKLAVGGDYGADIWDLDQVRTRLEKIGLGW